MPGEMAESMLEGVFCQFCGEPNPDILDGGEEPGFPWSCGCTGTQDDAYPDAVAEMFPRSSRRLRSAIECARQKKKRKGAFVCSECLRPFAGVNARRQHIEALAANGDEAHIEAAARMRAFFEKLQRGEINRT